MSHNSELVQLYVLEANPEYNCNFYHTSNIHVTVRTVVQRLIKLELYPQMK